MKDYKEKAYEASKGKLPDSFALNNRKFYNEARKHYKSLLRFYCHFGETISIKVPNNFGKDGSKLTIKKWSQKTGKYINTTRKNIIVRVRTSRWAINRMIIKCPVKYDETVNSLFTIKSRSKRAGKFKQHTYLVCFNEDVGYGYAYNTHQHFNKVSPSELVKFKRSLADKKSPSYDANFASSWVKDARTWGGSSRVEGMMETANKYLTMNIERRFGWVKNEVYRNKKTINTQDDLEKEYIKAFAKYCIMIIN